MRIFLIRHGETIGNASRIVQYPDAPLSPRGIAQAERLARRLAREDIAHIVSSDYARARVTAEHLQVATGAPLSFEPLLQERNFGDLRGTPYAELGFDMFAPGYAPPNGEAWEVFHVRVDRAWARVQALAGKTDGNLAVVTHRPVRRRRLEPLCEGSRPRARVRRALHRVRDRRMLVRRRQSRLRGRRRCRRRVHAGGDGNVRRSFLMNRLPPSCTGFPCPPLLS